MQKYLLRNLSELARLRAINLRDEAQLWDILSRDLKREAGRTEEARAPVPRLPLPSAPAPAKDRPLYVGIREAARMMGLGRSSLYKEINATRLPVRKAGKRTLIAVEDIEGWFNRLPDA